MTLHEGVRQLLCKLLEDPIGFENLIARMVILRGGDTLTVKDLPDDFGTFDPRQGPAENESGGRVTLGEAERSLIVDALEKTGWNKSKAAKRLDIPRHVLIYRLKKYGIEPPDAAKG